MSSTGDNAEEHGLSTGRIQALADGVFSIAMTLLVLELHPPSRVGEMLGGEFLSKLFAYFLSFLALGVFWVGHHNQFYYIKRSDRILLWINILYLSFIAFVPFSANLLGTTLQGAYNADLPAVPVVIYGANLTLCAVVLYFHWRYGINNTKLVHGVVAPDLVRLGTRTILRGPVLYSVATLAAFINIYLSVFLFVLVSLSYVVPTNLDAYWRSRSHHIQPAHPVDSPEASQPH